MKVTVVPAQVTTVEDRVAGNLSFSQLILFAIPVFGGSLFYAILPPFMGASLYKIVFITIFALICTVLAIRIKGKIVLLWLITLLRYQFRPRRYVFNKNSSIYREDYPAVPDTTEQTSDVSTQERQMPIPLLGFTEKAHLYDLLNDPIGRLRFDITKKGGINVSIPEAKD
jgi:hypothetical protein